MFKVILSLAAAYTAYCLMQTQQYQKQAADLRAAKTNQAAE